MRPPRLTTVLGLTLTAAPAAAAGSGDQQEVFAAALLSVGALVGAALLHWALRRLERRLPRWLSRQSGRPLSPGTALPWEGTVQLVLLVPKVALWVAAFLFATTEFMTLERLRHMAAQVVVMSVTSPLFRLNERGYSALDVLELPLVLAALWLAVGGLTRLVKVHILRSITMERGILEAVALLTRYTLTFLGAIVVLQVWGIDVSSLTFVASVLGVGIGFGLQHIANNFVSGLVVSIERPIQPGDFVKVGEWMGTVERIAPRNTEIRTLDNVSILVPNSRFLESEVINWTHGDPVSRLHVPVGVAYGSDIARVRAALLEAAHSHPDILTNPRPRVEFRSFGDSALHFDLLAWTRDPRIQFRLISDLNYRIEANLRRARIQIPFPQRDLHLRSPELEHVLRAWSQRNFTTAELAAPVDGGASPEPAEAAPDGAYVFEDDLGPRSWSDAEIKALVSRMRGPGGVSVSDRRHLLTLYPQCFVGREAVDWMCRALGLTREEAVMGGQILMDRGTIHHVLDEHGFKDGNFFYRFRGDEEAKAASVGAP